MVTLHSLAIKWIAEQVKGEISHGVERPDCYGRIPDISVKAKGRQYLADLHEVEVVKVSLERLKKYSISDGTTHFLWIVLPNVDQAFDFIKVIKKSSTKGFDMVHGVIQ